MAVVKPAEPRIVDLLVASGVELSTWTMPAELREERPRRAADLPRRPPRLPPHAGGTGRRLVRPARSRRRPRLAPKPPAESAPAPAPTLERLEPPLGPARARHRHRRGRRRPRRPQPRSRRPIHRRRRRRPPRPRRPGRGLRATKPSWSASGGSRSPTCASARRPRRGLPGSLASRVQRRRTGGAGHPPAGAHRARPDPPPRCGPPARQDRAPRSAASRPGSRTRSAPRSTRRRRRRRGAGHHVGPAGGDRAQRRVGGDRGRGTRAGPVPAGEAGPAATGAAAGRAPPARAKRLGRHGHRSDARSWRPRRRRRRTARRGWRHGGRHRR